MVLQEKSGNYLFEISLELLCPRRPKYQEITETEIITAPPVKLHASEISDQNI